MAKTCPRMVSSTSICMAESAQSLITCPTTPSRKAQPTISNGAITVTYAAAPAHWINAAHSNAVLTLAYRPHRRIAAGVRRVARNAPPPVAATNTTMVPSPDPVRGPAEPSAMPLRASRRTSRVLMPNTIR